MLPTKTYLIIFSCVALFYSSNSIGQKKDSVGKLDSIFWLSTTSVDNGLTLFNSVINQDTIPVIMLVCDTTKEFYENLISLSPLGISEHISKKTGRRGYFINGYINDVWWMLGYVVYPSITTHAIFIDQLPNPIYLDQNKKPLPKSIIVWMSKEIK